MEEMIEVCDLKKSYGKQKAIQGVSFRVGKGQFFALLGPNGAGKSTVVNILSTSLPADSGLVRMDGLTLGRQNWKIRKEIGIVFQNGVLDNLLTVEENLFTRGSFYGLRGKTLKDRIADIAGMTGTEDFLHRQYGQLSGGQRRRCDIARALLHSPRILFLDEPTTGLDPEIRSSIWQTIAGIQLQTGMTIFLTTHYMEEAARADHIVIMKSGRLVAAGAPSSLKEHFSKDCLVLFTDRPAPLTSILEKSGTQYRRQKNSLEIPLPTTLHALPLLELCRGRYSGFEVLRGNIDDAYLSVIGGDNRNASFWP